METISEKEIPDLTVPRDSPSKDNSSTRPQSPDHEVASFTDGLVDAHDELDYRSDEISQHANQTYSLRPSQSTIRGLPRQSDSGEHVITRFDDTSMVELDLGEPSSSSERNVNVDTKSCTLPASLDRLNNEKTPECSIFDPNSIGKLSKWGTFKRRLYLGAAHNMHVKKAVDGPIGPSTSDTEEAYEGVTDFEGLDLEGVPTMTQKSRKLFSWSRLRLGFGLKKRHPHDTAEIDEQAPVETPEKASRNKWLGTLSHRLNPLRLYEMRDASGGHRDKREEVAGASSEG